MAGRGVSVALRQAPPTEDVCRGMCEDYECVCCLFHKHACGLVFRVAYGVVAIGVMLRKCVCLPSRELKPSLRSHTFLVGPRI